uniref:Pep3/Vps18 beta-propeller domain-containing protein n=1 Tax=Ananas comosus var. bracteatus TaxID=296719 RepID=A0A6V7NWB9_ANACO|nr:unnamed protein product [Ananas comosus var. bracteatus]
MVVAFVAKEEQRDDARQAELHFFIKQRRAKHFGWLSGAGIYHGDLNFGAQHSSVTGDENFVENKGLLDCSKLGELDEGIKPRSFAVSEYHFLLLIGDKVKVCVYLP